MVINSAEDSVRIHEAADKLVESAGTGGTIAHVYKGATEGRGFGAFEVIVGSDNANNQIIFAAQIFDNGVNLQFNDDGSLKISGQADGFKLGDQTFYADYQNKIWN